MHDGSAANRPPHETEGPAPSSTPARDAQSIKQARKASSRRAPEQDSGKPGSSLKVTSDAPSTKSTVAPSVEVGLIGISQPAATVPPRPKSETMDAPDPKRPRLDAHENGGGDVTPTSQNGQAAESSSSRRQGRSRAAVPTAAASRARRSILTQAQEPAAMSAIAASYLAPKVEPAAAPQALVGPAGTSPGPLAVRSSALGASPAKMAPSPALEIFYRTPSESIALALNRNSTLNGASTSGTGEVSPAANESSRIRSRNSRRDDSARNPFLDGIPSSADGRAQSEASTSSVTPRHNSAAVPSLFVPDLIPGSSPVKTTKTKKGKTPVKSTNDDAASILNDDFCSACNGIGRFLCCDGCPKSFHFYCLEPPLELDELPPEDEWFCKECRASKRSTNQRASKYRGLFGPLLREIDVSNPTVFTLPKELKTLFVGVLNRPDGAYVDGIDAKAVRYDRNGFPEDRDPSRLKNKNRVILCQRCKMSAAPIGSGVAQGLKQARRIVSCDYCSSSWHLDCLDPPMINMPHPQRKWMCPNHAQHVAPKRKNFRIGVEEYLIDRPGQTNNGNIEIVDEGLIEKQIECEELYINAKRYKVPEKIVRLDFWAKIGRDGPSLAESNADDTLREPSVISSFSSGIEADQTDKAAETLLSLSRLATTRPATSTGEGERDADGTTGGGSIAMV